MSSSLVITLAVIAGVAWLAFLLVSTLRTRGKEQVPSNLAPGRTDEELETRRLERVQMGAVVFAGFLAVSLPLYFLGETQRQESFVEQFGEESIDRGAELVAEFGCFNCHGPGGSGGTATYIEKRSQVTTDWHVPSLDDIFFRYSAEEVNFWVTYGRPNTPMPAWGLAGGGAMNENQVQDIVNYIQSIQIGQQEALSRMTSKVNTEQQRLASAEQTVNDAIAEQAQLVANIQRAPDLADGAVAITDEMREELEGASVGIDTDGDGLSDIAETNLSELSAEFVAVWDLAGVESVRFDAANSQTNERPDTEVLEETLAGLEEANAGNPILAGYLARIEAALAVTGDDADGDGITDGAEGQISGLLTEALAAVRPLGLAAFTLDPANAETVPGESDLSTAEQGVSAAESNSLQLAVTRDNQDRLLPVAEDGLAKLQEAAEQQLWNIDIEEVAAIGFGGDSEQAGRAVYLFNSYCARCHTAGWSAGLPFTQRAGSGGFGPALWDERPNVQFLTQADLEKFITQGSIAQTAYGVNGIGSGRMPAFGEILSAEDISLIASYLRSGAMTGGDE
ncbi:MAG: c-type cytochrome [Acidimicrobiia bacterium]|nr:c-type cytochrome [Acidimicrobiia bacterium]MDQ3500949.1 c-type cytochrome [Actinomycetota bacterium]